MTQGRLLLETTDSSLRLLSLVNLYTAIYLQGDLFDTGQRLLHPVEGSVKFYQTLIRKWFQRPVLTRSSQASGIVYRCPLAKAIAPKLQISPQQLVRQIAESVRSVTVVSTPYRTEKPQGIMMQSSQAETVWLRMDLVIAQDGWLEFWFDDRAIQTWLLHYAGLPPLPLPSVRCSSAHEATIAAWHCWHSYERCSNLLAQARCLELSQALPKLNGSADRNSIDEPLRSLLLDCLSYLEQLEDSLSDPQITTYLKLGDQISQVFQDLTRHYSSQEILRESTIALGLVTLIQRLLESLLQASLGHEVLKKQPKLSL